MTGVRRGLVVGPALLLAAVATAGCTGDDADVGASAPSAAPSSSDPDPAPTSDEVELAPVPPTTAGWTSTLGLPVAAAVRTTTPLARLGEATPEQRLATCERVAAELDQVASLELLSGLAVSADRETATLLLGDLRAKADLLAVCDRDDEQVAALVDEVAATHAVAVAWLAAIEGAS